MSYPLFFEMTCQVVQVYINLVPATNVMTSWMGCTGNISNLDQGDGLVHDELQVASFGTPNSGFTLNQAVLLRGEYDGPESSIPGHTP